MVHDMHLPGAPLVHGDETTTAASSFGSSGRGLGINTLYVIIGSHSLFGISVTLHRFILASVHALLSPCSGL